MNYAFLKIQTKILFPKSLKNISEKGLRYSQANCFSLCKQKNILDTCKCTSSQYLSFYNVSYCTKDAELACVSLAKKNQSKYFKSVCEQECPEACYSVEYNGHQTFNNFNTDIYLNKIRNKKNYLSIFDNETLNDETIRIGLSKVNIYYSSLSYRKVGDSIALDSVGLLAAIGGFAGLFLGLSLLSLVEIFKNF
jgi:hypothetical protein